jgi:hypothetical protein
LALKTFLIVVAAAAGLALVRLFISLLLERRATRAFRHYLEAARAAGVEEGFMARFNSTASYGDSMDRVIRGWGAARIRRMYEEAIAER